MVVVLLTLIAVLLVGLVLAVLGTLAVLAQSMQAFISRFEQPGTLQPGDTLWVNALGQLRECIVSGQDEHGNAIVRPIGPNITNSG